MYNIDKYKEKINVNNGDTIVILKQLELLNLTLQLILKELKIKPICPPTENVLTESTEVKHKSIIRFIVDKINIF